MPDSHGTLSRVGVLRYSYRDTHQLSNRRNPSDEDPKPGIVIQALEIGPRHILTDLFAY